MAVIATPAALAASRTPATSCPAVFVELAVVLAAIVFQHAQGGDAGRHRQRVSAQRSRLIDRPEGSDQVHDLRRAAVGADGQAAADDLAHRHQVGLDVVELRRAAEGQAEAGHHFVEDQHGAFALR